MNEVEYQVQPEALVQYNPGFHKLLYSPWDSLEKRPFHVKDMAARATGMSPDLNHLSLLFFIQVVHQTYNDK